MSDDTEVARQALRRIHAAVTSGLTETESVEVRAELDDLRHALALRAFTAPDADDDTMMNSLDDRIGDLIEDRDAAEASRRDWAAEADRQTANAAYEHEAHRRLLHDYDVLTMALADLWGDKSKRDFIGQIQRDNPYRPGPTLVIEDDGTAHLEGPTTVCACISDEQAAALSPRFSRPVCALHPTEET